jgi:aspartate/methionine/tyrosine aminotransferase
MLLAEHQTSVVPGRFFEAPAHFRIAFGGVELQVLRGALAQLGRALDRLRRSGVRR